jgi:hypothetical protein
VLLWVVLLHHGHLVPTWMLLPISTDTGAELHSSQLHNPGMRVLGARLHHSSDRLGGGDHQVLGSFQAASELPVYANVHPVAG